MNEKGIYSLWNESFREHRNSIKQRGLKIIILGPSEASLGYNKRIEIREHIKGLNDNFDVSFPEEIEVPADVLPDDSRWTTLDFIIGEAQIIFALLIDHDSVTGVLGEVTKYGERKGFRDKAFLIVPEKRKVSRGSYLPQIWAAASDYPSEKKLHYSEQEFADCSKIRDYAGANADLRLKRICWEEFMKSRGMTDF